MNIATAAVPADPALDNECINTLRFLSVDAVQKADSGHPGMPMGAAAMEYVLWTRSLKHNPANPDWFGRDRFVLSPGHGSYRSKVAADPSEARKLKRGVGERRAIGNLKAASDYLAGRADVDAKHICSLGWSMGGGLALQLAIHEPRRDKARAATCLGFGPRFQHSTGQAYKGGPNSGVFLQVTCDDPADIDVPGHSYSFGVVKAAQASGDLVVLVGRGRRALRVHLTNVDAGLEALSRAVDAALE